MRSAYSQTPPEPQRALLRRRVPAFLVAILIQVGLVMMLLSLAPFPLAPVEPERKPVTFQLLPERGPARTSGRTVAKVKRASGGARARAAATPATPPPPTPPAHALQLIPLTRAEFAASNIGALPSHSSAQTPDGASASAGGTGTGSDTGADDGPGEGPGGERLYNAEWYVKPTNAELAYYLPKGRTTFGWGMIACRTVADYHVDDCRELGDSPAGSGLARAVRQAAWQFRVMPPRIGAKRIVGAWVRIRIDYTQEGAKRAEP